MRIIFILTLILLPGFLLAQENFKGIKGIVKDNTGATIPGVSIVLMNRNDSTLIGFTSTNNDGLFEIKRLKPGQYILQFSSLAFQDYSQTLTWTENQNGVNLGDVILKNKINELKEVNIAADHIPLKIIKDTIEYNAKAFKTQPNAVVEDLLKKLPGVEVDKDGSIKAQGKQVNKVLVDGKEFFGDDPKMATRNLPADAINNVQVYDKKSDAAEFTGSDDGVRDKTINLKLKDDKKQGLFGKLSGGYGTSDRYETRGNINSFKKESQLSAVGMSNNTNTQGFTINDYINFMGGLKNMMSGSGDGGRVTINAQDIGIPLGNMNGKDGFTNTNAGGLNYNRDISKKTDVRSSYFFNDISKNIQDDIFRQNTLGTQTYNTSEFDDKQTKNQSHRLNFILKHKIDSFQQITWRNNISRLDEQSNLHLNSRSYLSDGKSLNSENTLNDIDNYATRYNSSLAYLKKINRKGRNLALTFTLAGTNGSSTTHVNSLRSFYRQNIQQDSILNQKQQVGTNYLSYSGKISYTEPLGKKKYLELNYIHENDKNVFDKKYYDIASPFSTEVLNNVLSNKFTDVYQYDKAGVNLKITPVKQTFMAGVAYQRANLNTEYGVSRLGKNYFNFLPNASWLIELGTGKQFQTFYRTSINAPSGEQLQPVVNNTNPLNLYKGNPNLHPEYLHSLGLNYSSFDQFNLTSFFAALDVTYTQDKITYARSIDSVLVQTNSPVNVDHDISTSGYSMVSTPLRFMKSKINIGANSTFNRSILYLNNIKNNVNRYINTIDVSLENSRKEIVDFQLGVRLIHNLSQYSISSSQNQNFLNKVYYLDVSVYTKNFWTFSSALDYTFYQGSAFGAQQEVPILKASVSKQFLKNNRAEIKLSAVDLLNKNVGINRSSSFNYIQDEHIHTLGRYFMLTFTYSLSKFGGNNNALNIKMDRHGS